MPEQTVVSSIQTRRIPKMVLLLATLGSLILLFFAWQHFYPVVVSEGWSMRVYRDNVSMVSALAKDTNGVLYFTHEHKKPLGSIYRQLPDGSVQKVMEGLDKPDGLVAFRNGVLASQEGGEYPLLWLHDGIADPLFVGMHVEGVESDGKFIYAIEDLKTEGRLIKYDPETKATQYLRSNLQEAETVAACPDGRLYYAEKKRGWIKHYRQGETDDPVVLRGLNAPGYMMCNQDGLWISEDATHLAKVLLYDFKNEPRAILSHLRAAQTVLSIGPGHLLVSEQGRNRILEIRRATHVTK